VCVRERERQKEKVCVCVCVFVKMCQTVSSWNRLSHCNTLQRTAPHYHTMSNRYQINTTTPTPLRKPTHAPAPTRTERTYQHANMCCHIFFCVKKAAAAYSAAAAKSKNTWVHQTHTYTHIYIYILFSSAATYAHTHTHLKHIHTYIHTHIHTGRHLLPQHWQQLCLQPPQQARRR